MCWICWYCCKTIFNYLQILFLPGFHVISYFLGLNGIFEIFFERAGKVDYTVFEWESSSIWWYQILEQTFHEVIFTYRKSIKMWQERLRALWQISLVCTQYRHSNAITLKLQWIFNNPMTNYSTRVFKIMWCPYLLEQVHSGIN